MKPRFRTGLPLAAVAFLIAGAAVSPLFAQANRYGIVLYAEGTEVSLYRDGELRTYDVMTDDVLGMPLLEGDLLQTEDATFLEIQLLPSRTVVKIAENTSFRVAAVGEGGGGDIALSYGRIRARVERLSGDDEFRIRGAGYVAGVRGTDFGYDVTVSRGSESLRADVYVFEGEIALAEDPEATAPDTERGDDAGAVPANGEPAAEAPTPDATGAERSPSAGAGMEAGGDDSGEPQVGAGATGAGAEGSRPQPILVGAGRMVTIERTVARLPSSPSGPTGDGDESVPADPDSPDSPAEPEPDSPADETSSPQESQPVPADVPAILQSRELDTGVVEFWSEKDFEAESVAAEEVDERFPETRSMLTTAIERRIQRTDEPEAREELERTLETLRETAPAVDDSQSADDDAEGEGERLEATAPAGDSVADAQGDSVAEAQGEADEAEVSEAGPADGDVQETAGDDAETEGGGIDISREPIITLRRSDLRIAGISMTGAGILFGVGAYVVGADPFDLFTDVSPQVTRGLGITSGILIGTGIVSTVYSLFMDEDDEPKRELLPVE
jgi:hypothetical protein